MSNLKQKLGLNIQKYRKLKGLTQEKLAELLEMDTPNLSNIERGKNFMTSSTLEKFIEVLEISEKELFDFQKIEKKESIEDLKKNITKTLDILKHKELSLVSNLINDLISIR